MEKRNEILKLLIVICGLSLTMAVSAVNYKFSKTGRVQRATPLQEFDVQQQPLRQYAPKSSASFKQALEQSGTSAAGRISFLSSSSSSSVAPTTSNEYYTGGTTTSSSSSRGSVSNGGGYQGSGAAVVSFGSFGNLKRRSSTVASAPSADEAVALSNTGSAASPVQSVAPLYNGFDNQDDDASEVSTKSFGRPSKLPGDDGTNPGHPDPITPVGEGLAALLLMAGLYLIGKRRS